jgi:hypothetical protein
MKNKNEFEDVYENVVIENYGIPVVITDTLVRKHKSTGRNVYINHPKQQELRDRKRYDMPGR